MTTQMTTAIWLSLEYATASCYAAIQDGSASDDTRRIYDLACDSLRTEVVSDDHRDTVKQIICDGLSMEQAALKKLYDPCVAMRINKIRIYKQGLADLEAQA